MFRFPHLPAGQSPPPCTFAAAAAAASISGNDQNAQTWETKKETSSEHYWKTGLQHRLKKSLGTGFRTGTPQTETLGLGLEYRVNKLVPTVPLAPIGTGWKN